MKVTTRKLDATDTDGDRIKVTAEDGATATFPYPYRYGLDGREAHKWAIRRLFDGDEFGEPVWLEETARGGVYDVPDGEKLAARDKITMKRPDVRIEERRAAFRRHNRRAANGPISQGNV